jgi:hypothetical protein
MEKGAQLVTQRRWSIGLLTAAIAVALAVTAIASVRPAQGSTPPASPVISRSAVTFHDAMRKLWEDHITWTRMAIIGLEDGTPDTDASVARLLRNQVDIGNAVKPFYGKAAGNALTGLLRDHILIAADVIAAAKAGNQTQLAYAQARWVDNADRIAAALHSLNPRFWKLREIKAEMHRHLDLTTQEAVARLQHDWTGDVAAYDRVHRHILHMADMLSAGIIAQFPGRFR